MAVDVNQLIDVWNNCQEPDMSDLDARLAHASGDEYNNIINEKNRRRQQGSINCMNSAIVVMTAIAPPLGAILAGISGAIQWITDTVGWASSGPGRCGEPDRRPTGPQDPNWVHLSSYQQILPPTNVAERALQPSLIALRELRDNCVDVNERQVFNQIIKLWNDTHEGPFYTARPIPVRCGFAQGCVDSPLIYPEYLPVSINLGPAKSDPIITESMARNLRSLDLGTAMVTNPDAAKALKKPSEPSVLTGVAIAGGAVLGGSAIYALATKQSFASVWKGWYRKGRSIFKGKFS